MPWELDPVTVQPTSRNHSEAIEASYARLSENGGADVANYASYSVRGENLFVLTLNRRQT